ncbi:putative serine/threonine-protein kinase [Sesbania bispinosa]|nr:putative serine/threonine-protein kinase [Sesbania bispinosa]
MPMQRLPVERSVTPTQPTRSMPMSGEAHPPLEFIKQNLQKMTSILENSGNNLSPQMRAKLDSEIKNLLRKNPRSRHSWHCSEWKVALSCGEGLLEDEPEDEEPIVPLENEVVIMPKEAVTENDQPYGNM